MFNVDRVVVLTDPTAGAADAADAAFTAESPDPLTPGRQAETSAEPQTWQDLGKLATSSSPAEATRPAEQARVSWGYVPREEPLLPRPKSQVRRLQPTDHDPAAQGRAWQILPATSPTRDLNPRSLSSSVQQHPVTR